MEKKSQEKSHKEKKSQGKKVTTQIYDYFCICDIYIMAIFIAYNAI